ncbi:uncharacterized protein [Haliotis asinina]|uniref:uncharacterized protein isoform X1 n=1 Tax=Haliotis asinina TaxID=109174 RepID=UPI0035318B47
MRKKFLTLWLTEDPQHGSEIRDSEPAGQTVTRPTDKQGRNMPFRGFLQLFGFKKKKETAKPPRQHPYDEVNEADIKDNQSAPKRRPREYDEIEIEDDGSGPSVVAESSTKPEVGGTQDKDSQLHRSGGTTAEPGC